MVGTQAEHPGGRPQARRPAQIHRRMLRWVSTAGSIPNTPAMSAVVTKASTSMGGYPLSVL